MPGNQIAIGRLNPGAALTFCVYDMCYRLYINIINTSRNLNCLRASLSFLRALRYIIFDWGKIRYGHLAMTLPSNFVSAFFFFN